MHAVLALYRLLLHEYTLYIACRKNGEKSGKWSTMLIAKQDAKSSKYVIVTCLRYMHDPLDIKLKGKGNKIHVYWQLPTHSTKID